MQHMVIFRSSEGKPGYQQAEDLDGAVTYVEHLRNAEQVVDARIFRMEEVAIEYKTYYRVEVAPQVSAQTSAVEAPAAADAVEPAAADVTEAVDASAATAAPEELVMTGPTPVSPSSRFGLFNRT